jgi:hypothetical protein
MDLQILFFTVTYRIIHVTVMSHSRDDNRKEELNLQKCHLEFFMFLQHFLVMSVEIYTNLTQMNEWGYS